MKIKQVEKGMSANQINAMAYELDHLYWYQQAELTDMLEDAIALWRSEDESN